MRSTRLRFLETTSFSVHIKLLALRLSYTKSCRKNHRYYLTQDQRKIFLTSEEKFFPHLSHSKHLFLCNENLSEKKPSISFYYYLKQTVEYIETMNQEWDSNPGPCSILLCPDLGFEPALSPCSPTWYCQIPPPITLAPSEVLNGNTNTDVLDVGEITNQDWEHSPERASSEKQNVNKL